ncbi:hypothetical protein BN903_3 [Halorubrum sp. AJ67]|nr:hypothetical protein BN903_3 [Halorubrum sp. AJ67]
MLRPPGCPFESRPATAQHLTPSQPRRRSSASLRTADSLARRSFVVAGGDRSEARATASLIDRHRRRYRYLNIAPNH